jgi:PAS domain S-box-containing protein
MPKKKTHILIVGAGKGGSLLIELFHKSDLAKVLGVVDKNPDAPGIKLAKKLRIPTSTDFKKFLIKRDLEEVINVTGKEKVQRELLKLKPPHVEVIGGYSAKFMWNLIEERKRSEIELKDTLSLHRATVESTADGILVVSRGGKMVSFNQKFLKMWEIPESITLTREDDRALAFVLDQLKDPECFLSKVKELYANPSEESFDVLEFKDGRVFERFSQPQKIGDTIVGRVWSFRDVTKHKQAEDAIRESEEKFRAISSTAADAILVMDNKGKISYWNPSAERMFGYTSDEALGKELHIFLAPSRYHAAYEKGMQRFLKTGKGPAVGHTSEFFAIRKDGTEFPIEVSTSAIRITGQWHSVGIVRDITDRKHAEHALRESEQKYRTLFEESKDIVYISTPEGQFLDINPAGVELFGYDSREELLQINISEDLYVHPFDREEFQYVMATQGFIKDFEVMFKRKDGQQLSVLITATTVHDQTGTIVAYRGIMKDITERKRLEQQLIQAQKMEAVGQLAGGIAHDFNNILTAIIGFGTLLKMETEKGHPLHSYVTQILTSAERAANLTQALLAFSRKQVISPKPVNLNKVIVGVKSILSRIIGEDIELSTNLTDNDLIIMADSGQIEQVLMNLATNSRDALPDGGSLTISTDLINFDYEFIKAHGYGTPGLYALISVEDTGKGMEKETEERIFEPFFTTKEVGKGTGLGLSMVYGIIQQHDGYINVYSEPDIGTTFKLYMPLIKSTLDEGHDVPLTKISRGSETVLVAEDDAQVRELIKEVLNGFGYTVLEAHDGESALRVFSEHKDRIHVMILDVIMPNMNGKEIYNDIKKIRPDIKCLFTSGYDANIIHKKGILEENLPFISKPVSPEELLLKIREILDSKL